MCGHQAASVKLHDKDNGDPVLAECWPEHQDSAEEYFVAAPFEGFKALGVEYHLLSILAIPCWRAQLVNRLRTEPPNAIWCVRRCCTAAHHVFVSANTENLLFQT